MHRPLRLPQLPAREDAHARDLLGWLPVAVLDEGLVWFRIPPDELRDPFFIDTANRLIREGRAEVRLTGLAPLLEFSQFDGSLEPTAFIFQTSRCGSTLITNALRSIRSAIVHSEPLVVSASVFPYLASPEPGAGNWGPAGARALKGAIRALSQRRPDARSYFVKLLCIDTLLMPFFREVWPEVPMVFVYRHPLEVAVANLRDGGSAYMGMRAIPEVAARLARSTPKEVSAMSAEEYSARVLSEYYRTAIEMLPSGLKLLPYEKVDDQHLMRFVESLGIELSADETDSLRAAMRINAKNPRAGAFKPDSAEKRNAASSELRDAISKFALPRYEELTAKQQQLANPAAAKSP